MVLRTIGACSEYFPGRLYRLFIVNGDWTAKTILPVAVYALLDKITVGRISICKDLPSETMDQFIARSSLEEKYGGDLPNVEGGKFFPPDLNTNNEKMLPSSF